MGAVDSLRAEHQFVERQVEQRGDFFPRPVVAGGCAGSRDGGVGGHLFSIP
jgi:hypothetical protein